MALVLDATVGGANSNAYLTQAEADSYHESRLHTTDWTAATSAQKEAAIVWATRTLDRGIAWAGAIRSYEQALSWPRAGIQDKEYRNIDPDVVPDLVKYATAELARLLIIEDRAADREGIGFSQITVGPLSLSVDKHDQLAVIPDSVYDLIREFGERINAQGNMRFATLVRT